MAIFYKVLQFVLSLSFLVMIHEFGHFAWARIFGVRVSKFYMFFNPNISLFRMKRFAGKWHFAFFAPNVPDAMVEKKDAMGNPVLDKKGNPTYRPMTDEERAALPDDDWRKYPDTTEWGLGWLPLGGYCAIEGMVDETTTSDQLASEPKPWEYRSLAAWKRLLIITGGVMVNLIGAFVIYSAIMFTWGESYYELKNAKYGLQYSEVMVEEGFCQGDHILTIGERTPNTVKDVVNWILIDGEREVAVLRGDEVVNIHIADGFDQRLLAAQTYMVEYRYPFVVSMVPDGTPAALAGMQAGDSVVSINGMPMESVVDVMTELPKHAMDSITVGYYRAGELCETRMFLGDEAKMGVVRYAEDHFLTPTTVEYGFFESIPAGIKRGWSVLEGYVKQLKIVFTKEGAKSVGGFMAIGNMFTGYWDWVAFWSMTAFLSVVLAFMNIIPIPGLDGGHTLFVLIEMLTGKKMSDKFLEIANQIGMYLLLALLILANANDIIRFFFH